MSIGNGKALRHRSDTRAALPLLAWAVDSNFPVLLHSARRKIGSCSFTAALIGGKTAFSSVPPLREEENRQSQLYRRLHRRQSPFPVFLLSEGRKTGNCSFTAVPIGGKVDFPVFIRSERRETGNCGYAAGTSGGNISIRFLILFFSFFCLLVGHGSGLCSTKWRVGMCQ